MMLRAVSLSENSGAAETKRIPPPPHGREKERTYCTNRSCTREIRVVLTWPQTGQRMRVGRLLSLGSAIVLVDSIVSEPGIALEGPRQSPNLCGTLARALNVRGAPSLMAAGRAPQRRRWAGCSDYLPIIYLTEMHAQPCA